MAQTLTPHAPVHVDPDRVLRTIRKRSFAVLSSSSETGRSHAAGVLYATAGRSLYLSTLRSSRKARNVASNGHVGLSIPVRRLPVGPPSSIMFQSQAEIVALNDPHLRELTEAGELKSITGHGELELPDGCFIRIDLPNRIVTYGLGMSLLAFIRDPLDAAGYTEL